MSTTVTIAMETELDIINKYEELIASSLGSEGCYIRTKETLQAMMVMTCY